jgi:hypothetical protein
LTLAVDTNVALVLVIQHLERATVLALKLQVAVELFMPA